jgi:hypothetical protein
MVANRAGTMDLALRLPNSDRLMRRFRRSDRVQDILNFIRWKGTDVAGHVLTAFPSKVHLILAALLHG